VAIIATNGVRIIMMTLLYLYREMVVRKEVVITFNVLIDVTILLMLAIFLFCGMICRF
jgi:hypothetical protein